MLKRRGNSCLKINLGKRNNMKTLNIQFHSQEALDQFVNWLSEQGEQSYWDGRVVIKKQIQSNSYMVITIIPQS